MNGNMLLSWKTCRGNWPQFVFRLDGNKVNFDSFIQFSEKPVTPLVLEHMGTFSSQPENRKQLERFVKAHTSVYLFLNIAVHEHSQKIELITFVRLMLSLTQEND
ncbi:hypothetical protein AVEN_101446-1 [Araneus ventricosus]|uniref:Uncharacterized protein n=1 Tax=Araneus ventricosus TaxID=182803 RepID=A0A4Y2CV20_ARAVE|nr:hypothetical protein AVEN_101446-1 [Araneus ventricosus]